MDQPETPEPATQPLALPPPRPGVADRFSDAEAPPLPSVLRLLVRSMRQTARRSLLNRAPTIQGQLIGAALLLAPAVAHPLPLPAALHVVVQLLAVLAGFVGTLLVFGGMALRLFPTGRPGDVLGRQAGVLHGGAVLLCVGLAAGAGWCLVLAATRSWADHLADAVMLGLPAAALAWGIWVSRGTWAASAADDHASW